MSVTLVVGHIARRRAELGVRLDDLVDGRDEVLLGGLLATSSDREHPGLGADAVDIGACRRHTHNDYFHSTRRPFHYLLATPRLEATKTT